MRPSLQQVDDETVPFVVRRARRIGIGESDIDTSLRTFSSPSSLVAVMLKDVLPSPFLDHETTMSRRPQLVRELVDPGGLIPRLEHRLGRLEDSAAAPVQVGELRHLFDRVVIMAERYAEIRRLLDPGDELSRLMDSISPEELDPDSK